MSHRASSKSGGPVIKQGKNERKQDTEVFEFETYLNQVITRPNGCRNHPNTVKTFLPIGYKEADNDNNCARRIGIVV